MARHLGRLALTLRSGPVGQWPGVKVTGRWSGPKMPTALGFHVTAPSMREVGEAAGEQGQRFLELGAGEGGAEAVVDAGAERQLRLAGGLAVDVERAGVGEHRRVVVGRRPSTGR